MIQMLTFPKCFKIRKIDPICKPKKLKAERMSYRPILILNIFEKIPEEWIKSNLEEYLETHNILLENHQGAKKKHNTFTAMTVINHICLKNLDEDKLGIVISDDISSFCKSPNS